MGAQAGRGIWTVGSWLCGRCAITATCVPALSRPGCFLHALKGCSCNPPPILRQGLFLGLVHRGGNRDSVWPGGKEGSRLRLHCVGPQGLPVPADVTIQMRGGEGEKWTDSRESERVMDMTCVRFDMWRGRGKHQVLVERLHGYWCTGWAQHELPGRQVFRISDLWRLVQLPVLPRLLSIFW